MLFRLVFFFFFRFSERETDTFYEFDTPSTGRAAVALLLGTTSYNTYPLVVDDDNNDNYDDDDDV